MFINQIDELIDTILNNFNNYITELKFFKKLTSTSNFVKYQNDIIKFIKTFIESMDDVLILKIIKKNNYDIFINTIKKYCAFYIYLGIAYYFKGSKELFITNIIECSRAQVNINYDMDNFFNSYNNSKIITYFIDIKNILSLSELRSIDKINAS